VIAISAVKKKHGLGPIKIQIVFNGIGKETEVNDLR
jgi:hypothetical protein